MSFTSLITFRVARGRSAEFEEAFTRAGMLTRPRALAGYHGAELHRGIEDPQTYIVVGHWDSVEAYRQWQARSLDHTPDLERLLDTLIDPQPGQLYEPVASG